MKTLIRELHTQDELTQLKNHLQHAVDLFGPKGINLSASQRQTARKMGIARLGYANLILPIAINNINELPRDKDPQKLANLLDATRGVAELRGMAQKLLELIDDTNMALGIDALSMVDSFNNSLQNARKDNDGLDKEMSEVDAYNSRFGKQMETEDTSGQAGTATAQTPPATKI